MSKYKLTIEKLSDDESSVEATASSTFSPEESARYEAIYTSDPKIMLNAVVTGAGMKVVEVESSVVSAAEFQKTQDAISAISPPVPE